MNVPWLDVHETCNWNCHIANRNSDLGDDFGVSLGTPVPAPLNGTLRNAIRPEPAPYKPLYIAYFTPDGGSDSFEFMHFSQFAAPGHYLEGQTIGWSGGARGAVGAGRSTGPHLHANGVSAGRLIPVRELIEGFASTGDVTPVVNPALREDDMYTSADGTGAVYATYTDANGALRMRVCGPNEASFARVGGLVIIGSAIAGLGQEAGWVGGSPLPQPLPKVNADVTADLTGIATTAQLEATQTAIHDDIAKIPAAPTTFKAA